MQLAKTENQEKKEFLSLYSYNEREISRLEDEIEVWSSRAQKITASYHNTPIGTGGDKIQDAVAEIAELRAALYSRLLYSAEIRCDIERLVSNVPQAAMRLLLEYRYIDSLTWEAVAEKLFLDVRWVMRLHNKALETLPLDFPYKEKLAGLTDFS